MAVLGLDGGVAFGTELADGVGVRVVDAVAACVGDVDGLGDVDATGCCPHAASSKTTAIGAAGLM